MNSRVNVFGFLSQSFRFLCNANNKCRLGFLAQRGFTLAEVLITLSLVGIVGAMTIPIVLSNIQDHQYRTLYKKAYANASQALVSASGQGLMRYAAAEGDSQHLLNFDAFMDQFKIVKRCVNDNNEQCWDSLGEKSYADAPWQSSHAFIDSSGFAWSMYYYGYFRIFVDTNGFKKPNQWGKDRFVLEVHNQDGGSLGMPTKISPLPDNHGIICLGENKCATENNYFGTSWLY